MSLASSLKRVLIAAGVTIVTLGAATALVPALLPGETVRRDVADELTRRMGLPVTISGPVSVSVVPQLSIRLDGVRMAETDATEPQATAEAVVASFRLLPLITGKVSISEYVLVRPRIAVRVARDGASNWDRAFRRLREAARETTRTVADLRIVDGEALVTDEKTESRAALSAIEFAISWPGPNRQANISGTLTANGEPVEVNAVVARPLALFTAEPTGVKMRVTSAPMKSAFEGTVTNGDTLTAAGAMTLETGSLRQLLRWLGQNPGIGPSFGTFALKGDVQLQPNSLAFTKVNTELDGNVADGALSISFEGARPQVQGTLDAGRVVATTYFRDLRFTADGNQGWNRRPIDLSAIAAIDLDLRLSASEVIVGHASLGRSAAAVVARGGRLTVTLGEAQAYGGTLSGALVVAPRGEDMDVRASLNVQRAQLGLGLGEWFGFRRLDGTANTQLSIEARGASMADLARTATGQMMLTAVEGAVHGFNAEAILRRLERRPLATTGADARSGRTAYDRIAATIRVVGGVATTTDLVLDGPMVRVNVEGVASLPAREFDMRGIATLKRRATSGSAAEQNFELPFVVQGPWDDPFILPDPQALIRRSGAAAPLRDVTRDRDALRAVLDAINRHASQEADLALPPPASSYNPFAPILPRD
ncbi:MAG: AsmA family protein [Proteobacteria bacterium]|nr:AsmA family protein [Pseudomonadota bacterium]